MRARLRVEALETRSLLNAASPAAAARAARNTPVLFTALLGTLQRQLTRGPLAQLAGGATDGNRFVAQVDSGVASFETRVARRYGRSAPGLVRLVDLQGTALTDTEAQWNVRRSAGLYPATPTAGLVPYFYLSDATTTIRRLTLSRPLWPMGTPNLALYQRADTLAHNLQFDVVNTLQGAHPLSPATAKQVGLAEAQAFQADFDASLTARPLVAQIADVAATTLENNLGTIDQPGLDPLAQAQRAQQQFVSQVLTGAGLFGPQGPLAPAFQAPVNPFPYNQYYRLYTFTNAVATRVVLTQPTTFYRVFSDPPSNQPPVIENNYKGAYTSTQDTFNSRMAIRRLALDQSFFHPNLATMKVDVMAPAGTTVYVGQVAPIPQGVFAPQRRPLLYPGGFNQTVILDRSVTYADPRPIAARP
jgi:hypothetical protein